VPEVLAEVKDAESRRRIDAFPFQIKSVRERAPPPGQPACTAARWSRARLRRDLRMREPSDEAMQFGARRPWLDCNSLTRVCVQ
jgi:hypothetical protein